jgi:cellulose synthase/poly-beta-1,6-N-acetylglucosamine synthase-like glycosyltransferase
VAVVIVAISRPWSVGVVIPAQNEELTIERCIESVIEAHATYGCGAQTWIVVVADSCTDKTVELARRSIRHHGEVLECASRSPGSARRLGGAAVIEHFRGIEPSRIWLANTDADTYVPSDWLQQHLEHADDDASAVAGIVRLDETEDLCPTITKLYRETYALCSDGTHTHVHGANLGVRADAYLDVGGWSHVTVAEDHCLWSRLKRRGWRLRSPVSSVVVTSARLHGRAIGGFADTLRLRLSGQHA